MINFVDKINNIIENKKSVSLRFLTLYEQNTIKNRTTEVLFNGGYPEAELKRASFYSDYVNNVTCFKISHKSKLLTLTHPMILGTLLSLSITKDSIGDILPDQGLFFIINEIKEEIINSFTTINNVPITLEEYTGAVESETRYSHHHFTTSSLRLDLIVSKITKTSRASCTEMILSDLIKVNHIVTTKHTKTLQENDVISIRKHGRFIIGDTTKTSKKGKIIVNYRKFV